MQKKLPKLWGSRNRPPQGGTARFKETSRNNGGQISNQWPEDGEAGTARLKEGSPLQAFCGIFFLCEAFFFLYVDILKIQ